VSILPWTSDFTESVGSLTRTVVNDLGGDVGSC